MIDLTKLEHMRALARYGTFVRAAEAVFITQPALSRSIKSLEEAYAVKLFTRTRRGVILTPEGRQFLLQAEALLTHAEAVERDITATTKGERQVVAFGIGPMAGAMLLGDLLDSVLRNGTFAVSVQIGSNRDLRVMLLNGEIEFFVGGLQDPTDYAQSHSLNYEPLSVGDVGLFVRDGHPLVHTPSADLQGFPLICGSLVRQVVGLSALTTMGLSKPLLEVDDYDLLLRLAATSDALLVASRRLLAVRDEYKLVEIRRSIGAPLQAGIVTVQERPLSRFARTLVKYFTANHVHDIIAEN